MLGTPRLSNADFPGSARACGSGLQFSSWPQARRDIGFGQERGSPDPPKADLGVVLGAGRRPALLAMIRVIAAKMKIAVRGALALARRVACGYNLAAHPTC
jgi:hypothetical protein